MYEKRFFGSLTRISDLERRPFRISKINRDQWDTGDYVIGLIDEPPNPQAHIEQSTGRMVRMTIEDEIIGALGARFATLGVTGSWQGIGDDGSMHVMTAAGLIGKAQSRYVEYPSLLSLKYLGHACRDGKKLNMKDFVQEWPDQSLSLPVVLLVGSSMSSGKTTTAKVIIRMFKQLGLRVIGAKLTGAGRYRDIQSMQDAGADHIFDFVDVGLPSTVVPQDEFQVALRQLLNRISAFDADVLVAEAGASPLEPYNGAHAVNVIKPNVRFTILCATDPYSVLGVEEAFGEHPNLVTGIATSTEAGISLIEKLTGIKAINILDSQSLPELKDILLDYLRLESRELSA